MEYIDRNYNILKEKMIQQMEKSLSLGRKLIDTELDAGFLNFIIRPVVKAFYDYWSMHDARKGTLKQINLTLEAGKQLLLNGKSEESFNSVVEEYFPEYLKGHQVTYQCSKRHKNYEKLKENTKETFVNYLKEIRAFLSVEEDINDYSELARFAFKNKEMATKNLMKQLEFTDKSIRIIEEDFSILSLPAGKRIIIKSLRKGFEETKKEFLQAIDETYD